MSNANANPIAAFEEEKRQQAATYPAQAAWQALSRQWMEEAFRHRYMYNFSSLGRPIIQTPIDMVAFQEIVWNTQPDLIIETGIAHGGSLVYSASLLALLDYCDAVKTGEPLDPKKPKRRVLGVDIDIRAHNRAAIEAHPMANRIDMIQGSSTAPETVAQVKKIAAGYKRILVCLDSNHTHEHVLDELDLYAPLTTPGSYCLVFDTIVEDMPDNTFPDRPWHPGNSPKSAVHAYLAKLAKESIKAADGAPLKLAIDREFENKLLLTVAPDGYLKRMPA
jgi:cephalosporin hydroxylase